MGLGAAHEIVRCVFVLWERKTFIRWLILWAYIIAMDRDEGKTSSSQKAAR